MLFRPQTAFLLLTACFTALNINTLPLWEYGFTGSAPPMTVYAFGRFGFGSGPVSMLFWVMNGSIGLMLGFTLLSIVFYNMRRWQERFVTVAMISSMLSLGFSLFAVLALQQKLGSDTVSHHPQLGFLLLILCPLLLALSRRGIHHDENIATAYRRL